MSEIFLTATPRRNYGIAFKSRLLPEEWEELSTLSNSQIKTRKAKERIAFLEKKRDARPTHTVPHGTAVVCEYKIHGHPVSIRLSAVNARGKNHFSLDHFGDWRDEIYADSPQAAVEQVTLMGVINLADLPKELEEQCENIAPAINFILG